MLKNKQLRHPKLSKYKLSNEMIADIFKYNSANSFNNTTSKDRILDGLEEVIDIVEREIIRRLSE